MVSAGLSQRLKKPKTHKGKKVLEDREPKLIENDKKTLFIPGSHMSIVLKDYLHDLHKLKHQDSTFLQKNNPFLPFNDDTGLERFSQKHDASLFLFGSHQKKRPHNLIFGRMFDYHILDMVEVGVQNYLPMKSFQVPKCALDTKPCLIFHGDLFQSDPIFKRFKSILIDMFQGPRVENIRLQGTELALCFTAVEGKVLMRSYRVLLKQSGTKLPRVELAEMGPRADLLMRRNKLASDDLFKMACKQPKELKVKKVKNITHNVFGTQLARIHVGKQDLSRLQTRKVRALKGSVGPNEDNSGTPEAESVQADAATGSSAISEATKTTQKKRTRVATVNGSELQEPVLKQKKH